MRFTSRGRFCNGALNEPRTVNQAWKRLRHQRSERQLARKYGSCSVTQTKQMGREGVKHVLGAAAP
eukprot:583310-Pleurochrysis_carterae.AAC.1